jgi:hypothetical protein
MARKRKKKKRKKKKKKRKKEKNDVLKIHLKSTRHTKRRMKGRNAKANDLSVLDNFFVLVRVLLLPPPSKHVDRAADIYRGRRGGGASWT